jgi:hypothetical protein
MRQQTLASQANFEKFGRKGKRELFLDQMEQVCLAKIPSGHEKGLTRELGERSSTDTRLGQGDAVASNRDENTAKWTARDRRAHLSRSS